MQQLMGMAQQLPQAASGLTQGLGKGGGSGIFQQVSSLFQQGLQAGQQAANVGKAAQVAEPALDALDAFGGGGGLGALGAGAGLAGTVPSSTLGPPSTPSTATFASAASSQPPPPPPPESAGMGRGGMGGYPMMPPGAHGGAAGATDPKADTKRVVPPSVKNGAPVQGRINTPPKLPPVTKSQDGKPVPTRNTRPTAQKPDGGAEQNQ